MSMLPDKGKLADEQLELRELKDRVFDELEGCTDTERNLVILKDMEGFSVGHHALPTHDVIFLILHQSFSVLHQPLMICH